VLPRSSPARSQIPKDSNWTLNSICYLFNLDDLDVDEVVPQVAIEYNLDYVLSIADIQSIIVNANQQCPQWSELDLLRAFLYYYENDAFITLSDCSDSN